MNFNSLSLSFFIVYNMNKLCGENWLNITDRRGMNWTMIGNYRQRHNRSSHWRKSEKDSERERETAWIELVVSSMKNDRLKEISMLNSVEQMA